MARKVKDLLLLAAAKAELEKEYRRGKTHCYRERCRMVLLKAEGCRSKEIARQTRCCEASVNSWIKRYEQEGIKGLQKRMERGRKPLLNEQDEAVVLQISTHPFPQLRSAKIW